MQLCTFNFSKYFDSAWKDTFQNDSEAWYFVILRILDRMNSSKNGAMKQGQLRSTKIATITSDDSRAKRFSVTERLMRVSDAGQEDTQHDHDKRCLSEGS